MPQYLAQNTACGGIHSTGLYKVTIPHGLEKLISASLRISSYIILQSTFEVVRYESGRPFFIAWEGERDGERIGFRMPVEGGSSKIRHHTQAHYNKSKQLKSSNWFYQASGSSYLQGSHIKLRAGEVSTMLLTNFMLLLTHVSSCPMIALRLLRIVT